MSTSIDCCEEENYWFDKTVTRFMQSVVDAGIFVHLVNSGYAPRKLVDVDTSNIPVAGIIATQPLAGAIAQGRRIFGNQTDFPDLASSYGAVTAIVLTDGANNLLAYIGSAHGLGVEPDGTTISIKWDADGIFGL